MNSRVFQTVLAVQEVRFLFLKPKYIQIFSTIPSHKKLYRIQLGKFLITEHIFGKIRPELLNIEFLKGGTLLY